MMLQYGLKISFYIYMHAIECVENKVITTQKYQRKKITNKFKIADKIKKYIPKLQSIKRRA